MNSRLPKLFPLLSASGLHCRRWSGSAARRGISGGFEPIPNPNDPTVVEVAKFAVDEHNKEAKTNLKFQRVVEGKSQLVAGKNYELVIAAADGAAVQHYLAGVYSVPWEHFKRLTYFSR